MLEACTHLSVCTCARYLVVVIFIDIEDRGIYPGEMQGQVLFSKGAYAALTGLCDRNLSQIADFKCFVWKGKFHVHIHTLISYLVRE